MPGIRHKPVGSDLSQAEWEADDSHIVDSLNVGSATGAAMGEIRASGALYASAANLGSATGAQSGELRASGLIFTAGLNVGSATGAASGEIRASGAIFTPAVNVGTATGAQSGEVRAERVIATRTRSIWVPVSGWNVLMGTPSVVTIGAWPNAAVAWVFNDSAHWRLATWVFLPRDYHTGGLTCFVMWTSASATTGACRWHVDIAVVRGAYDANGDAITKAHDAGLAKNAPAPATAGLLRKESLGTATPTVSPGDLLRITLGRIGDDPGDTMVGDARFVGLEIQYTAVV